VSRPPFALLSVVVLLGAGVVAGHATEPSAARQSPVRQDTRPVEGAIGVCPELLRSGTDVVTRLSAGVATAGDVTVRAATLAPGTGLGKTVLHSGAHVGALRLKSNSAVAAVVTASGPQSGGLEVAQVSRGADGPHRGWAGMRCEAPSADSWFLGADTTTGNDAQLVLVNPYDDAALVRVELYGGKNEIDVPELDGIVLPARGRVVRELAGIAPDESQLAVHVVAREGRVAPAVRVTRSHKTIPYGVDWLPRLNQPATQVDVPGIPEGNGRRFLHVFAPGLDDAHLRIQFTVADEQYVPDGYDDVEIPAGKPVAVDLTKELQVVDQATGVKTQQAVALRVFAEGAPVLVTASLENRAVYGPIHEIGFVGPAPALTGPTLVMEGRNDVPDMHCALLISAPDGAAKVTIRTLPREDETAPPAAVTLSIPQGRLVRYAYGNLPKEPLNALVVTADSELAPVYVTRVISEKGTRGPLFTTQAMVTQPTAGLDIPIVSADPVAALPAANRED
jgi:hypothetical protein